MHIGIRIFAAFATLLGLAFSAAGASAQISDDSMETSCVSADLGGQQLQVGIADRTTAVPVALPAGTISIPSARATDGYPNRVNVTQLSEKYEVEFISASGDVIATSIPTGDVPDMVVFGEWIGSLGTVELSEPAVAIRAHHLPNLPFDGSPESVRANEITFCFQVETGGPTVDPVCGDTGVTTNPDGSPCDPVCGDTGVTTNPDGSPCDPAPVCGDTGVTTNPDGSPCDPAPVCGDTGVTTNPDGSPCDPAPVCGDTGVTTNPDGSPCDPAPVCGDTGVTTNPDGSPCDPAPVCGDTGVTTNPDGTPCTPVPTTEGETTSPTIPGPTTTEGEEVAGPTTSTTTADPSTTAGPTTTEAPTTSTEGEEVAGPEDNALPITGSNSGLLLALGGVMLLAGGALVVADRRIA